MTTHAEWELICRCREGSTASFEPLVRRHEGRALAVARALLRDPDEAEDAVQDAFVRAYNSLHRLQPGSAFGPWLYAILRNLCLDRLRSPRRKDVSWTPALDAQVRTEPTASASVERAQLAAVVQAAMTEISAEHREILVLKELEGMSYTEMAEHVGVPAGTVASRLFHARAELKKALIARGHALEELLG